MGSTDADVALALKIAEAARLEEYGVPRIQEERPQHMVRITKPFRLGVHEVTIGQFGKFIEQSGYKTQAEELGGDSDATKADDPRVTPESMKLNWRTPGHEVGENSPVTQVNWNDAVAFCNWMSEQEKLEPSYVLDGASWSLVAQPQGYRLPTEAEWEYACRAGTTTQFSFGDDWKEHDKFGWSNTTAGGRARGVGLLPANPFGLHDMHGNVWEWCHDWYNGKWYAGSPGDDPQGPHGGSTRVYRGGSWYYTPASSRSSGRSINGDYGPPEGRFGSRGFRIALGSVEVPSSTASVAPSTPPVVTRPPVAKSVGPTPTPAVAPFDAEQAKAQQEAWARHLGVPVEFTNSLGMKFRLIPPGEFLMGSDAKEAEAIAPNIKDEASQSSFLATIIASSPRHSVRISRAFYLQTHEVTNGQYLKVMKKLPDDNDPAKPESPVLSNVSLADATAFCNALSETEGKSAAYRMQDGNPTRILKAEGYRLPTEAEWEYACRAGTTTMWFQGENGDMVANGEWLKELQTLHVGADAKPNPFGLVDLYAGSNEWCFDRFAPYGADAVIDPFTDPSGADGVLRGGNHFSEGGTDVVVTNSFARQNGFSSNATNRYTGLGRVVLPIEMPQ